MWDLLNVALQFNQCSCGTSESFSVFLTCRRFVSPSSKRFGIFFHAITCAAYKIGFATTRAKQQQQIVI